MATESAGQGKDMDEDKKGVPIKFQLSDVILKWNDKVAACKLRMPSVLLPSSEDPTVVFELVLDPDDWHSFKMMKEIVHPSILHLRAVLENGTDYWGLVEPHTGILYDYLKTGLGMPSSMKTVEVVLPTDMLRTIVKQILDGLEYLMYRGRYHGNFSLKSTYYHRRPNGIICAKLTGFKEKDQKNSLCQTQDVLALGQALDVVSSIAVDYNNKAAVIKKKGPRFDTFVIDDLSKKLKLITEANLRTIYQDTRRHPFFWELEQRTKFFIYKVASAMNNKDDFKSRVASCNKDLFTQLKWDLDDYDGFLQKMNKFRTDSGKAAYDGSLKCDFVLFICGLYTHEKLLKNKPHTADNTVMKRHPHLCVVLSDLLGSDNGDWL